jgi:hypothetical protein
MSSLLCLCDTSDTPGIRLRRTLFRAAQPSSRTDFDHGKVGTTRAGRWPMCSSHRQSYHENVESINDRRLRRIGRLRACSANHRAKIDPPVSYPLTRCRNLLELTAREPLFARDRSKWTGRINWAVGRTFLSVQVGQECPTHHMASSACPLSCSLGNRGGGEPDGAVRAAAAT